MDLNAKCAEYMRAPSTGLRAELLEDMLAAHVRAQTIANNAVGRSFLASEQRRVERSIVDVTLIASALTETPTTRLADARARLAAVG